MQVQMPWRESALPGGLRLQETIATSRDGLRYLAGIVAVGKRGVVFFTAEGPASAINRYSEVRAVTQAVVWK
jgi:hypothetical protein